MSREFSRSEERDMERMAREDAMVANYDPAVERAREEEESFQPYDCEVCGADVAYRGEWCPRCQREQQSVSR